MKVATSLRPDRGRMLDSPGWHVTPAKLESQYPSAARDLSCARASDFAGGLLAAALPRRAGRGVAGRRLARPVPTWTDPTRRIIAVAVALVGMDGAAGVRARGTLHARRIGRRLSRGRPARIALREGKGQTAKHEA